MATMGLTTDEQKAVEAFKKDVVEPSMQNLVILDFWAEWCGPCKELTPVLEKVAADYAGRGVLLAKINVDENKFIASQFQVRSIPTVYAIFQGQPVADLSPARTEPQLKQMIDQLLDKLPIQTGGGDAPGKPDIEPLVQAGEELLAGDGAEQAHALFAEALAAQADHAGALSGMIRALGALGRHDEAQAIMDSLDTETAAKPEMERAKAALAIAADAGDPDEMGQLKAAAEKDAGNHQARFDLANAQMAAGDRDGAAENLLHIVAAERDWNEGAAKARLLEIFEMIGLEDPWVAATRRKLSAILFG